VLRRRRNATLIVAGNDLIAIGAKAVQLMQQRMSGEKIASRRTIFDVALIERDSVRRN
jgi:DNA-binding LacI/PurR family transcriptional regulator